jgi:hypothetical protein
MKQIHNYDVKAITCSPAGQVATLAVETVGQDHFSFVLKLDALARLKQQIEQVLLHAQPAVPRQ